MALEEVFPLVLALGSRVEVVVIAVFEFSHQEIARVDLSIDSNLGVGH